MGGHPSNLVPPGWFLSLRSRPRGGNRGGQGSGKELIPALRCPYSWGAINCLAGWGLARSAAAQGFRACSMTVSSLFHPAVAAWFDRTFAAPTAAQAQAWPAIQSGRDVLIAAPTGSGKTLAAFLAAIDALVRQGLETGLQEETQVVYVSPLKALSNDIQRNLEAPLLGIREALRAQGLPDVEIRSWVRTGDTPAGERQRMHRRPPHIVVTTPESLYILLGSESGRDLLKTTRTVIVDEIHAMAPNKRGTHLSLSLERLDALCGRRLLRIGLSATQKPIETVASFLLGAKKAA